MSSTQRPKGSIVKRQAPTVGFVIVLAVLAFGRALLGFMAGNELVVASIFLVLGFLLVGYVVYKMRSIGAV